MTLTTREKLDAICSLNARSGIKAIDFHDCRAMSMRNVEDLTDKDCERISAIFAEFFEAGR